MHRILTAQELNDTLNKITFLFPKNTRRKKCIFSRLLQFEQRNKYAVRQ